MPKIECEECGRKTTVDADQDESRAPKRYCGRCGTKLPHRGEQ